ncbi:MAG: hypothetical protein US13_C0009G0011 [candidate division TM6 bacterium GW2011_GWE2_36_25]|nr:MAG: hypothetical protein US03_C0015G0018 [candidate division TM6 bacterium GW2011_GWF2_36_131]KKQ02819.1 MAG: hypothetical protein US13_C0009G0011 [candidate division TM6 bacterium GW2011_GWE2_36_25]KKQ18972.1 MAG: hypothetical protein US32_C0019G0015 [candidate division TM6 bacterium GW2011_GWA2_36_9]
MVRLATSWAKSKGHHERAHPDASSALSTKGCAHPELVEGYERI